MSLEESKSGGSHNDNWSEYRRLVLAELERLDAALTKIAEAILSQERDIMSCKEDLIDRMTKLKETSLDKIRELIEATKDELEKEEKENNQKLSNRVRSVEDRHDVLSTEIKVLKGKAALLGFLAGLTVAVISLVISYFESKQ
jgi:hypothetical protein